MITYEEQLKKLAEQKGIDLRLAFRKCGMPDSTFYRIKKKHTTLRKDTAKKVWDWLNENPRYNL